MCGLSSSKQEVVSIYWSSRVLPVFLGNREFLVRPGELPGTSTGHPGVLKS